MPVSDAQAPRPGRGSLAPAFSLPQGPDRAVSLAALRGRPVVLVFYPADWSPVCSDQLAMYQAILPEFARYNAAIVGISVDGVWCHRAFAAARGLTFPLLADFEPKGGVSREYGVYRFGDGVSERALFVLDHDGAIGWSEVVEPQINPGADGILRALDAMSVDDNLKSRARSAVRTRPSEEAMTPMASEHRLTLPIGLRDHIRGDLDAPLQLVEYGDYECPYCRAAYPIVRDIERRLEGRLCFAYRHFPIVNAHPHAVRAAEAAEAAGAHGRFWQMHDKLYVSALDDESLVRSAVQIGLDPRQFVAELAEHSFLDRIREDMSIGTRSGVNGTPTFFIGGVRYDGPRDVVSMIEALQRATRAPAR